MNYAQPPMMPVAKALANQGRMSDSTLVHMNPQEVAGLQSLARQNGTSLTINPQTGLPEAFNLGSVLPMVAGAALTPVLGPMAPLVVGGLGALATGSLEQGIMMGLGAYGGAGLATNLAGTAANLAAPASATVAAPSAVGGAYGGSGILASAAPVEAVANPLMQASSVGGAGGLGLQNPALSATSPMSIADIASSGTLTPELGALKVPPLAEVTTASQAGSPLITQESILNTLPEPKSFGERFLEGAGKVFESPSSFMDFAGENKMNLAMSAAPMLIPETPEEIERRRAMIRPYDYEVENLTGTDVDPFGTETERLRGRFVARDPYYAAQGGLMAFAEGGDASSGSFGDSSTAAPSTTEANQTLTPSQADVFRNIFAVQQLSGMPMGMPGVAPIDSSAGLAALPSMFAPAAPRPPVAYTPSMVGSASALDTSEKRYGAAPGTSTVADSADFASSLPLEKVGKLKNTPFGKVATMFNRAFGNENYYSGPPRSIVGYTSAGQPVYLASDNKGGFASNSSRNKFSYDPATGTYQQLAQGGLTSLKAGGLREGAFIVPADVISHLGNGSSEAGMKIVQERLKGRPIKGPGDGMSDSIPTTIAGKQPARVANEEAEIPPEVVAALGGGSLEKGAKKLYEMMDKIRKDRTGKKKQAPAVKADKYMPA